MIIAGIDPGKTGAIAKVDYDVGLPIPKPELFLCPTITVGKRREYNLPGMDFLMHDVEQVWIELAQPMPRDGKVAAFHYGGGFYAWQAFAVTHRVACNLVRPKTWKDEMLRDTRKDKGAAIWRVQQLFPALNLVPEGCRKANHNMAEAVLILVYGIQHSFGGIEHSQAGT